jgi:hypothetical protein
MVAADSPTIPRTPRRALRNALAEPLTIRVISPISSARLIAAVTSWICGHSIPMVATAARVLGTT